MVIKYTVFRLALFLVPLVIMLVLQVPQWPAIIIAALFSLITSFFLLQRQREEMARALENRIDSRREKREAKLARERVDEEE